MLQMTSLELSELIEQELVANPILEEVQSGDEVQEISDNILDQNANGTDDGPIIDSAASLDSRSEPATDFYTEADAFLPEMPSENGSTDKSALDGEYADESPQEKSDSFEEIDYGREFQDYLDPGYRTQEIEYKEDAPSFEQFLSHSPSLIEHFEWQLNMLDISEDVEIAAKSVIGNLDDDGRLQRITHLVAERAGENVDAGAGRERHDDLDRSGWKRFLCPRVFGKSGSDRERGDDCGNVTEHRYLLHVAICRSGA